MSIDYEALLVSSRVDDLEATGLQQDEPTLPTKDNPLEVYRLPDADVLPIRGGIYEWVGGESGDSGLWYSQAKVFVILDDDLVEHFQSKVFILRRDADPVMQNPLDSKTPYSIVNMSQDARDAVIASAAVARHGMDLSKERSPRDMFRELNEVRGDAASRYRTYEVELGNLAKLRAQQAKDKEIFESYERHKALMAQGRAKDS